jgi:CheY-like chemotaxis protein
MSSSELSEDIKRAYATGANSYVVKAPTFDKLQEAIEVIVAHWSRAEAPPSSTINSET